VTIPALRCLAALLVSLRSGLRPGGLLPGRHLAAQDAGRGRIDAALLKEAVDFAVANEIKNPRDLKLNHYQTFGREPFGYAIGPIKDRGPETGVIVHKGYIVAEWGEPQRVDMAHSVTKSMLSSVVGVAVDRGMIKSVNDTVHEYVPPIQVFNPNPAATSPTSSRRPTFSILRDAAQPHRSPGTTCCAR
jgi:CubicO group peptidase (beta-lactamase class C family)